MNTINDSRKLAIRSEIELRGFVLLGEFVKSSEKLLLICQKGHRWSVLLGNFRKRECPDCNPKNFKKYEYSYVKEYIESFGYCLVSKEYQDVYFKLHTICPNKHDYWVNFRSFSKGHRCTLCPKQYSNLKLNYDDVKSSIEQEGFILVSETYIKAKEKLQLRCNKGHLFEISWDKFKSGRRCSICQYENLSKENHWNWKGGITPEHIKLRNTEDYKNWRKNVFIRDSYTCQSCFVRGGKLRAHHILNFSEHIDKRHLLENGITMCSKCHDLGIKDSFHYIYGSYDNNAEQLKKFLKYKINNAKHTCSM